MPIHAPTSPEQKHQSDRWLALLALEVCLRMPMALLSIAWLGLIILDLTGNGSRTLSTIATVIWVLFIAEFLVRFVIAPAKRRFLGRNWLTMIALAVPAIRALAALRALRAISLLRGVRLISVVGTINRSMNALRRTLRRRGFGYVFALTAAVLFAGAAGMYSFEPASEFKGGFTDYWDALWWTAMLLTSIGSQYWPQSAEARILGFGLALYGLGILGYMTATIASFFIGRDADSDEGEVAGNKELKALRCEIAALRQAIAENREIPAPARKRANA
jgi:voltage-gated potassium channel